jgi:hypothetical protein
MLLSPIAFGAGETLPFLGYSRRSYGLLRLRRFDREVTVVAVPYLFSGMSFN